MNRRSILAAGAAALIPSVALAETHLDASVTFIRSVLNEALNAVDSAYDVHPNRDDLRLTEGVALALQAIRDLRDAASPDLSAG